MLFINTENAIQQCVNTLVSFFSMGKKDMMVAFLYYLNAPLYDLVSKSEKFAL